MTAPLQGQPICQVAIVVRDIDAYSKRWSEVLGVEVPAWRETASAEVTNIRYRGQSTEGRAKLAFFDLGVLKLELIEPIGGPSIWREHLDKYGEGVQHIAFRVPDIEATADGLAKLGMGEAQRGDFKGGCYRYVDSTAQLGLILELLGSK
ncbi:MAG: hypothetical protein AMXMBFR7_07140 [Planctomycetota bacterium]